MPVETDIQNLQNRVGTLELQQAGNLRESAATIMTDRTGARYTEILADLQEIAVDMDRMQAQIMDLLARVTALEP